MNNLDLWREYGDYVFMAMPYADEVITGAKGCKLQDANGKELLDLAAGMFCSVLGHNDPRFTHRIVSQTEKLLHTGTQFISPAVLEAGKKLAEVTPGKLQKSIFLSTGTEANEFAFRIAKAYTGRTGIVGFSHGYYGTSLATKSCSGLFSHHLKDSLPVVGDSGKIPITPQCVNCFTGPSGATCDFPCLDTLDSWIGDWSNIAAAIVEPVLSAGGMLFPPPGYFNRLQELVHGHGALLIVDEAQTGFGRTGRWFAIDHHGVEPDILSLSKSVGNGFPVATVTTTAEIADTVISRGLWSLSSHQSDPVGAAAVSAVIDIVREDGLVEKARVNGDYFLERLRELSARQPAISKVRGQGLMIGFDLAPTSKDVGKAVTTFMLSCRSRGVHLTYGYGGINFRIIPPLVITQSEIDFAIEVLEAAAKDIEGGADLSNLLPKNRHTRALTQQSTWTRLLKRAWQSTPEEIVSKASALVKQRVGAK